MNSDLLISKARVKALLRQEGIRVSEAFYDAFGEEVKATLLRMAKRIRDSHRKTAMPYDV